MTDKGSDKRAIMGHMVHLDETRLVFLGRDVNYPDSWYLFFRNPEGRDTRLRLSTEALDALVELRKNPPDEPPIEYPFFEKIAWQVVQADDFGEDELPDEDDADVEEERPEERT